jgi:ornithine cyclodeaminase/alanine dehydrogenase-like protein (mu-crystallin family)
VKRRGRGVRGADLIVLATASTTPVDDGDVADGAHRRVGAMPPDQRECRRR